MTLMRQHHCVFVLSLVTSVCCLSGGVAECGDWRVPFGGNAFRTAPAPGGNGPGAFGLILEKPGDVWSVYVHVDRPAQLELRLDASVDQSSTLRVDCGNGTFMPPLSAAAQGPTPLGRITATGPGYLKFDFRGVTKTGGSFGTLKNLLISSTTPDLTISSVRDNKGNMFHWGRRGPSVHLTYTVPRNAMLEYAYSELTVPPGQDQIGSYFMANGFREGYFGMQVNSETERRILFSVWSPYQTDDPRKIPEDQRVLTVARGEGVHIGEFGNEGAGGQSYLIHPWKAGVTCRFLTRVQQAEDNSTVYSSWFSESPNGPWRLIASFRRPQTQTSLKGFHSFLENFNPATGHLSRRVEYRNVQVRDTTGTWYACTAARFSTDATGSQKHRLDFQGGIDGDYFFLQNCGFFNSSTKPGSQFELNLPASVVNPPQLPDQPL
jgi:hypothetical protein